jgi:hypothetical protein
MAEREVLGFPLIALTAALAKDWNFCDLLHASIERRHKADPRVPHVLLGHSLAENVERGWDSPSVRRVIQAISSTLKKDVRDITQLVHANALKAVEVGRSLGLTQYPDVIPSPEPKAEQPPAAAQSLTGVFAGRPPALQEAALAQELAALLRRGCLDINLFFTTLLQSIIRDAGMDRVLLALLSPDLNRIVGKYGLGWEQEEVAHFMFFRENLIPHIFEQVLEARKAIWIDDSKRSEWRRYLTPEVKAVMSTSAFFLMPIVIRNQAVGLICADRCPSGRELDEESFACFTRIHQLAQEVLSSML